MFPLGSVLVPGATLPLHIFEPRYQQLLNDALAGDRRFGVVLISRGHEVGGGDTRTDVGTLAWIAEHRRFDDGRAAVVAVGERVIDVVEWLPDDPYPRARVRARPPGEAPAEAAATVASLREALGALVEAATGERPDLEPLTAGDATDQLWALCAATPLTDFDRQQILAEVDFGRRCDRLGAWLSEARAGVEQMKRIDEGDATGEPPG